MADPEIQGDPTPDPEPEGVVEVQGQKMVPVTALTAERERARTKTEEKIRAEYEPIKAKAAQADQYAADLASLQPYVEHLKRHPELMQQQQAQAPDVSDEEAEKEARDLELYTPTGLDITRAKRIIAKRRTETKAAAQEAAHAAVQPMMQTNAVHAARQNFVWAASQRDANGDPLIDPNYLAEIWSQCPPELTANPEAAKTILEAAIGRATVQGKRPQRGQEPVFTEVPGGRQGSGYRMSEQERKMARTVGLDEKQWTASAKAYQPDATNILGD